MKRYIYTGIQAALLIGWGCMMACCSSSGDDGGQPFIQHVRIIVLGIILHGITDQPDLAHAHTRVYIIRFAIDRNTNLNRPFITLLGPFSMVIY